MVTFARLLYGVLLTIPLLAAPARADEPPSLHDSAGEWSILAGYGITHRGFGETRTQVQTVDTILRYGHFLSDEMGNAWYRGRHELLIELPLHLTVDPAIRTMSGAYLLGSWKFTSADTLAPYVFAGGGVLYNDLGLPSQGTRLNFSYQGGFGLQYFVRPDVAFGGEYRYHHVSNAGTAEPNEPLNSSKFLFSISFFR